MVLWEAMKRKERKLEIQAVRNVSYFSLAPHERFTRGMISLLRVPLPRASWTMSPVRRLSPAITLFGAEQPRKHHHPHRPAPLEHLQHGKNNARNHWPGAMSGRSSKGSDSRLPLILKRFMD